MRFCLGIVLLLFLVPATLTQDVFNLDDAFGDPDLNPKPDKPKSGGVFNLDDAFGDPDLNPKPDKPKSGGDGGAFDDSAVLLDVSGGDYKPDKGKSGGGGGGGAVDPGYDPQALKPTEKPTGGDCQGNVVQRLDTIIEKQDQQLRLLRQLMARPPSAQ